jgi:hypothetical protein
VLESLREKLRARQRSVQDQLIPPVTTLVVFAAAAFATSKISKWLHRDLSDLASNLIGAAVAAPLLLWIFRKRLRDLIGPPRPKGDRLAIYVTRFKHDKTSRTLQDRIEATIRKDFGGAVQVLKTALGRPVVQSESSESEAAQVAEGARALLGQTGGEMVVWGKLVNIGEGSCEIHFVSPDPNEDRPREEAYGFRDGTLLDADFSADLGSALAARGEAYANLASDSLGGDYMIDALSAVARRFEPLVRRMPECVRPYDRGRLLRATGEMDYAIGVQSGENAPLEEAVRLLEDASDFFPRDRFQLDWARSQELLGFGLKTLGGETMGRQAAERGGARLPSCLGGSRVRARPAKREDAATSWRDAGGNWISRTQAPDHLSGGRRAESRAGDAGR